MVADAHTRQAASAADGRLSAPPACSKILLHRHTHAVLFHPTAALTAARSHSGGAVTAAQVIVAGTGYTNAQTSATSLVTNQACALCAETLYDSTNIFKGTTVQCAGSVPLLTGFLAGAAGIGMSIPTLVSGSYFIVQLSSAPSSLMGIGFVVAGFEG